MKVLESWSKVRTESMKACCCDWLKASDLVEGPVDAFKIGDEVGFVNAIRACGSCHACLGMESFTSS